ncbi:hypothetical protein BCR44DRAFT_1436712 [Catenaria anguillulae PL171]|uniref:Uncharacterized protein n=1 Tax=Catenaria anguillulae PL171 TaxID=765915 RepID=A0A1Y2HHU2_9FUNG|nr:hypothetical protein BCR44DRAFT_1436712 [Catenaria anguillulae PL171]
MKTGYQWACPLVISIKLTRRFPRCAPFLPLPSIPQTQYAPHPPCLRQQPHEHAPSWPYCQTIPLSPRPPICVRPLHS